MKLGKLLLVGAAAFLTFTASAQDDEQERECARMRLFAGDKGLKINDYKAAAMYLHKAEIICGSLDKDNWDRLIGSLQTVVNDETDDKVKKLYIDSVLSAYTRQEAAGFYLETSDLRRAAYIMQSSTPDASKADMYFQRGIKAEGLKTHESYIVYAYYATYSMYAVAAGDEQAKLKKRMIEDYFRYSEMVAKAGMTPFTQEQLTNYLNYVIESCDALLPEIPGYITNLPEDSAAAIDAIQRMLGLLEAKGCKESKEYGSLIDAWLARDPNSMDALLAKASRLKGTEAIPILRDIMSKTDDAELKAKCQYEIAYAQMNAGQYQAAYASGRACTGKYKSDGLSIAAKCVAATAMGCGDSTFERKCNYLYAAQLAEQAGQGGAAASYRASGPSAQDCFNENSPSSVSLSCWGVSVSPCN